MAVLFAFPEYGGDALYADSAEVRPVRPVIIVEDDGAPEVGGGILCFPRVGGSEWQTRVFNA